MTQRREMSRERGVLAASLVPLLLPLPEAGQVRGSRSHTPQGTEATFQDVGPSPESPRIRREKSREEARGDRAQRAGQSRTAVNAPERPRVRGTEAQGTSYWRDTDYREGTGEKKLLQEKKKKKHLL